MKIGMYVAKGENKVIGLKGEIPFKSDYERFKYLTLGKTLIMGRKTYESIGRPLGGRQTIVLSNKPGFMPENVFVVSTKRQALELSHMLNQDVAVVGGQRIYEDFMDVADRLYITTVKYKGTGDTFFPLVSQKDWIISFEEFDTESNFKVYERVIR